MQFLRPFIAILLLLAPLSVLPVRAQTFDTALWITWRATTYVPPGSVVRALPIPDTKIIAALDVIQNGRPIDISKETVYWYVNDELLTGGVGLTRISIPVPNATGGGTFTVRAALPDYQGGIAKTITIPVANPLAVIRAEAPGNVVRSSAFLVHAYPYFFDITSPDDLTVDWKVNGQAPRAYSDPFSLNITLDSTVLAGSAIDLALRLANPSKVLEFATQDTSLTFNP